MCRYRPRLGCRLHSAIVGYTADLQVEVRIAARSDVSLAGRLSASNPRIDRFLAEDKDIRRRAITEALAEAKLQAETIMRASGVKLGGVLSVSNLSFNGPAPYDEITMSAAQANTPLAAPPLPPPVAIGLKPRAIETQVRVQVVSAIVP